MSLTTEELSHLKLKIKERDFEISALNAFINRDANLSSPCVLINGYKPIGKTLVVTEFLKTIQLNHTLIKCDECVSKQMLLQRCFTRIRRDGCDANGNDEEDGQSTLSKADEVALTSSISDQFSTFVSSLETLFHATRYKSHHVLVLDRFDQCLDNCTEFIAAFSKMRECSTLVQNLSVIIVFSSGIPRQVVTLSNPLIEFEPYTEDQVVKILQNARLCQFQASSMARDDGEENDVPESTKREFYNQYVKFVVDSYYSYTGSNMVMLQHLVVELWGKFIEPIQNGMFSIYEIVKVFKHNIDLFTNDKIISNSSVPDYKTLHDGDDDGEREEGQENGNGGVTTNDYGEPVGLGNVQDLPYHSKFILLAAYLASYGNQRNDLHKYSKVKVVKYKKRASPKKMKRQKLNGGSNESAHLTRDDIDSRMLTANYVDLERILAILSVIYQHSSQTLNQSDKNDLLYLGDEIIDLENKKQLEKANFTLTKNIDLNLQIATLYSLGFLSKTNNSDILAARIRWKCNLDWNMAEAIAKSIDFPIADFLDDD
ncbi:Origin recognition complex (ORC) subunit 5 C-terminus family protein [Candida parapsilosis]|uniref:AAA_16 domain-containing protein n=2 Tax=Candida parapsilosis TaxID=5480 RepID=G8BGB4_CANPC|nr:uncharacterized protein CPAR2_205410 [Candida parapsilosis]KAF6054953.1 Origin recognition complex (ORC) subunit 5 C-terminus family protein [Candida parapsilosis]KAF6056024.1 Origin recognition complex (ORC) subunit 5 C-terminus family protein [Candida parapsilosis]KAF6058954.1 Origin recognition complex (ORC) subunit 5 C-terminus family protein [Candida parapsilosis]KAF6067711.1 Origin recognition complex (ORC) subunit 5 C-terminus family protein [Candida parapsilosis]KAI5901939.1 Origin 